MCFSPFCCHLPIACGSVTRFLSLAHARSRWFTTTLALDFSCKTVNFAMICSPKYCGFYMQHLEFFARELCCEKQSWGCLVRAGVGLAKLQWEDFLCVCVCVCVCVCRCACLSWCMCMYYICVFVDSKHCSEKTSWYTCKTLQTSATHCDKMRQTATHCNTLQHSVTRHTATHCSALHHTVKHCNTLQRASSGSLAHCFVAELPPKMMCFNA